jgi:hypothetical protein
MFAYRERRPRASAIAGAAEVQFLTAGNFELNADLAMNAVVGFATVPTGARAPNEEQADAGQHINTGNKQSGQRCANCAPGLETGQPPETVRGEYHRQRGVAARPGVLVRRAEKITSTQTPSLLVLA